MNTIVKLLTIEQLRTSILEWLVENTGVLEAMITSYGQHEDVDDGSMHEILTLLDMVNELENYRDTVEHTAPTES